MADNKRVVLIDFDGTVNSYRTPFDPDRPWELPDPPNPGAIAFLRAMVASQRLRPVIFTTRVYNSDDDSDSLQVGRAILEWLVRHGMERPTAAAIDVTSRKIPCALIIDDNAWRFEGSWPDGNELLRLTTSNRPKGRRF